MVLDLILNSFSILNLKGIGASLSSNIATRTLFEFQSTLIFNKNRITLFYRFKLYHKTHFLREYFALLPS